MTSITTEAEIQLLLAALRFPGHYGRLAGFGPDDPMSRENLRRFGEWWFGTYLCDWEEAYACLTARNLLTGEEPVALTEQGREAALSLEKSDPIYRYEYNLFFSRARKSAAHRSFCQEVYGRDMGQHGLADVAQLTLLIYQNPGALSERPGARPRLRKRQNHRLSRRADRSPPDRA